MAQPGIYSKLKRLFSTNTVVRNVGGKKLRVADTDNIQSFVNRRGIDRYHRLYSSGTGGYGSSHGRYEAAAAFQGSRLQLFRDYDMMDNDPIISSVMDIYADESTVKDEFGQILSIRSKNGQVQDILHNLFYDILNVEFNLWPWLRNMVKYGDFLMYLDIDEEYGIVNVIPLSIYETTRLEGEDPANPFSVRFKIENDFLRLGKKEFDNYEIAHFRLLADTNFLPYGKSMVEGGRRVWKQLQLMEDAMLVHRIMRAPDKRKITVDVGNIPPNEVEAHMRNVIDRIKKIPLIDPQTGDYNLRYNMQNITEDFIFPVRGKDSGTDIVNLPGLAFNAIEDIEYLRNKLMAAFKVPKSFLGYEEDNSGKASLAAQDVRFARTIERIQRIVVSELTKIAIIHLYVQGYRDADLIDFELGMTSPSVIYEQEKINLWKEKISLAEEIANSKFLSREWIYHNVLQISLEDAIEEQQKVVLDTKMIAELDAMTQQIATPAVDDAAGEIPPEAGDGEVSPEAGEEAQQIDSVDDILAKLEDEEESELEEVRTGRPKEGSKYGQDSHPRGRDPLGNVENSNALQIRQKRKPSKKSPLSLEQKSIAKLLESLKERKTNTYTAPELLHESNIMEDIDD